MQTHRSIRGFSISLSFGLLLALLGILWLAGGASRADVLGQVIVRSAAWGLLVAAILFGERPSFGQARPVWIIALAALALALVQLLPLPPEIWTVLPGRGSLLEASAASGQMQTWRPWSIVPSATLNSASSLVVPLTALFLMASLRESERALLPGALLTVVAASAMVGLIQFSGSTLNNPFINDTTGQVSGSFANRNHFALFMAMGCLLAPVWIFTGSRQLGWRGPTGLGLTILFFLTILASGSRAGLGLGVLALLLGLLLVRQPIRQILSKYPRWVFPVLIAGFAAAVLLFVLLSVAADRAVSINRLFALEEGQDMRSRGLPTVLAMIQVYFPLGSGIGSFDTIFRMHEPYALLKPTYFNHAHNDILEVVLDAGLPGLILLAAAISWWGWTSITAWRASGRRNALPKLGSAVLFLIVVASIFDYPARTPMLMAVTIIAGFWLSAAQKDAHGSPLPDAT